MESFQNAAGRDAGDDGGQMNSSAVSFHDFVTDDFGRGVRAPFDEDVRTELFEQLMRRRFVEDHDVLDAGKSRQQRGAIAFVDHGAGRRTRREIVRRTKNNTVSGCQKHFI